MVEQDPWADAEPAAELKKSRWRFRDLLSPKSEDRPALRHRPKRLAIQVGLAEPGKAYAAAMPVQAIRVGPAPSAKDQPEIDQPHVDRRKIEQPGPAESDFKTADRLAR